MRVKELSEYWTIGKMAKDANIPRNTLHYAVERGEVPCLRLGCGERLVKPSDVWHWMAEGSAKPGKPRTWGI